jgi:hypothetical protein
MKAYKVQKKPSYLRHGKNEIIVSEKITSNIIHVSEVVNQISGDI